MITLFTRLRRWIFDFSAGDQEKRRIDAFLRTALAETQTDAEFETRLRQLLRGPDGLATQSNWRFVYKRLYEYRRVGEQDDDHRLWAVRYLDAMRRLYENKDAR